MLSYANLLLASASYLLYRQYIFSSGQKAYQNIYSFRLSQSYLILVQLSHSNSQILSSCVKCLAVHKSLHMDQHSFWIWLQLTYLTLVLQRITSHTRDPKISSSSSEWGGQGKVESTLMAHTCGCEQAAQTVYFKQRGGGLQAEGHKAWLSV